jgi:hypothetical protein
MTGVRVRGELRRPLATLAAAVLGLGLLVATADGASADTGQCSVEEPRLIDTAPPVFARLGLADPRLPSGRGVGVAVVDSGVAADNVHLRGAVDPGRDFAGSSDGRIDTFGHGTALAGEVAASHVAGSGLVGVAPAARILPVRVFEGTGDDQVQPDAGRTAEGIAWAAGQPGVKVILVAQSTPRNVPALRRAVAAATRRGVLVVASAGNAAEDLPAGAPVYPAAYDEVLSVTAVDADGRASDAVQHGAHVDLAAPGSEVLTTFLDADDCLLADQPSSSYAAGYVAGIAALIAQAHPDETPADWTYRLLATAVRTSGTDNPGTGWGVVAPLAALTFVNDGTAAGPPNPRHAAPTPAPPQAAAPSVPPPDHSGEVRRGVGWLLAGAAALVVVGLLGRRLARTP